MKISLLPAILVAIAASCSPGDSDSISTCTVSRCDFENSLYVDGYVEPAQSTTISCPPYVEGIIGFLVEDGVFVQAGDLLAIIEVPEIQTSYDELKSNLEDAQAGLHKTQADLNLQYALLEAQVKNNEAETQIALLDSLQLKYATPNQVRIKELEMEMVTINKARFTKKLQSLNIIRQSEIKAKELKVQQWENRLRSGKEKLNSLTIKAPRDGLALRSVFRPTRKKLQVGDPAWHLMPLVDLPELTAMKVKIEAPEMDYKYINLEDSVIFSFDALPGKTAFGKIRMKSPVGQPYKEGSKVKFFDIEASIDSAQVLPDPGFTASCRILLKQVKDTLVVPQVAIFGEDSMKVVFVKQQNGFEMRQVALGFTSPKEAIISAGLQGDEQIALVRPPEGSIRKKILLPPPPDSIKINTNEQKYEE
ncbi:MAG: efflux RND transporter periplasmic adaptor subunit [Dysgonamonadaceae bacterium]|nr:efflux RND transporter periplasmic adaptor subunit [Dysgonamonadaceae bacterium]